MRAPQPADFYFLALDADSPDPGPMKIRDLPQADVVSIERVLVIEEEEDESLGMQGDLDAGTYAIDSLGRVWRLCETVSGLVEHFTESDGVKRRRAKRT